MPQAEQSQCSAKLKKDYSQVSGRGSEPRIIQDETGRHEKQKPREEGTQGEVTKWQRKSTWTQGKVKKTQVSHMRSITGSDKS